MKIITHTCPDCGSIIAANVLEKERVMKCPRVDCSEILAFDDLDEDARKFYLDNREKYKL